MSTTYHSVYKVTVSKSIGVSINSDQWNRTENPVTGPYIKGNLIYERLVSQERKYLQNGARINGYPIWGGGVGI